jgi:hypothetical protein
MSRALRSGAPRMLGRHNGAAGRWYDVHYRALSERLGPFDPLSREAAGMTASAWVTYRQATKRLTEATSDRETGRGRRPSAAAIRALEKRQGLAQGSYDAALRRLEELCKHRPTDLDAFFRGARS